MSSCTSTQITEDAVNKLICSILNCNTEAQQIKITLPPAKTHNELLVIVETNKDVQITQPQIQQIKESLQQQTNLPLENHKIIINQHNPPPQTPQNNPPLITIAGVKNIIPIVSTKGGVGKSTVTAIIALLLAEQGYRVGIADLDVYGPSIHHIMQDTSKPQITNNKMQPKEAHGIQFISMGNIIDKPGKALMWRGPMIHKITTQILSATNWHNLDYLMIDTPPGTGDVHITLSKFNINPAIIVTTPQQMALIDTYRTVDLLQSVKIKAMGIVENMSHIVTDAGILYPFGKGGGQELSEKTNIPLMATLPLMPNIQQGADSGNIKQLLDNNTKKMYKDIIEHIVKQSK